MLARIYERRYTEPRMTRQGDHGPFVMQTNVWARTRTGWFLESAASVAITLADGRTDFIAVIEGKGPRDPLDRPFGSRKRSAVEQALQYAVNLQIDWFLVTNMREIRLYHKGHDLFTYERFETGTLASDGAALKRLGFFESARGS